MITRFELTREAANMTREAANMTALTNLADEMIAAGYDFDADEFPHVAELADRFIVVTYDKLEGEHMVGEFIKASSDALGDFAGCPLHTGTFPECFAAFNNTIAA